MFQVSETNLKMSKKDMFSYCAVGLTDQTLTLIQNALFIEGNNVSGEIKTAFLLLKRILLVFR